MIARSCIVLILFRDPVHSIIQLDKEEDKLYLDIIDTPEFQRLRHIRQLGFSYFTYPGAEHSRFTHSLGVFHVMKRTIERIITSQEKSIISFIEEIKKHKELALVSALIHDVGHGPTIS